VELSGGLAIIVGVRRGGCTGEPKAISDFVAMGISQGMWHILRMARSDPFPIQLGDRGRLVLPAELRKQLNLREGDELLVTVQPDGSLRLASPRQAVRETRGLYRARAGGRSLSHELIAERRAEVKRQTSKS